MLQFDDSLKKINKIMRKGRLFFIGKFIAESSDCKNVMGIFHVFLYLGAQTPDMNINCAICDKSFVSPHMLNNLVSGVNPASIPG